MLATSCCKASPLQPVDQGSGSAGEGMPKVWVRGLRLGVSNGVTSSAKLYWADIASTKAENSRRENWKWRYKPVVGKMLLIIILSGYLCCGGWQKGTLLTTEDLLQNRQGENLIASVFHYRKAHQLIDFLLESESSILSVYHTEPCPWTEPKSFLPACWTVFPVSHGYLLVSWCFPCAWLSLPPAFTWCLSTMGRRRRSTSGWTKSLTVSP